MRLILLRHAKSSWDDLSLDDHDRPLAPRGRRAAHALNEHLAGEGFQADRVVSSTAVRARETARLVLQELAPPARETSELYMASAHGILEVARRFGDESDTLVLVGHNPGMHALATRLARRTGGRDADRIEVKFPTAALAEFDVAAEAWEDVAPANVRLARFLRPKDLPRAGELRL